MFALFVLAVCFWIPPGLAWAESRPAADSSIPWREAQESGESELDRLNPAFVQIRVTAQDAKGTPAQPLGSRGSGFIIDPHGYVLTAQHVIDKAKDVEIRLA